VDRKKTVENLTLNVNEIFYSLQGEGSRAGLPCVFVRLQGCNLCCDWCDTAYARDPDAEAVAMTAPEIISAIEKYNCRFVLFTGGEPLAQPDCLPLIDWFCQSGYTTAVETNGTMALDHIDPTVIKIVDIKCPGSKMSEYIRHENIAFLTPRDEVKFVIGSREDYEFAVAYTEANELASKCGEILFSPVSGRIYLKDLAEWIIEDRLNVRLQVQLHKVIWGPNVRGV